MNTLDGPVYEVKKDSEWYKSKVKRKEDVLKFFRDFQEKYGSAEGFSFYHSEYFGVYPDTPTYEIFKESITKNQSDGFYPIKKRSKAFKEINSMLEQIEQSSPFKSHDVFGLNNTIASQWVGDRLFYSVKRTDDVKDEKNEVEPIDYKEYLQLVINTYKEDDK